MARHDQQQRMPWLVKLLLIVLSPLIVVIAIVFLVTWAIASPCFAVRQWRQRRKVRGFVAERVVLVWTSRRGWDAFVRNNVLSVLDARVVCAIRRTKVGVSDESLSYRLIYSDLRRLRLSPAAPFLISLDRRSKRFQQMSLLNDRLRPYKSCGRRSDVTQEAVRTILNSALREHGAGCDRT